MDIEQAVKNAKAFASKSLVSNEPRISDWKRLSRPLLTANQYG